MGRREGAAGHCMAVGQITACRFFTAPDQCVETGAEVASLAYGPVAAVSDRRPARLRHAPSPPQPHLRAPPRLCQESRKSGSRFRRSRSPSISACYLFSPEGRAPSRPQFAADTEVGPPKIPPSITHTAFLDTAVALHRGVNQCACYGCKTLVFSLVQFEFLDGIKAP